MKCDDNYKCEGCKYYKECYGEGVYFERLRRVTGYLSGGGIQRMNNAKQAEVRDRMNEKGRTEGYHKEIP